MSAMIEIESILKQTRSPPPQLSRYLRLCTGFYFSAGLTPWQKWNMLRALRFWRPRALLYKITEITVVQDRRYEKNGRLSSV